MNVLIAVVVALTACQAARAGGSALETLNGSANRDVAIYAPAACPAQEGRRGGLSEWRHPGSAPRQAVQRLLPHQG